MKKLLLLPILALSSVIPAHASPHGKGATQPRVSHPTASGSFLGAKVYTVPDLVAQVENNPAIAARYARHYHTTPANVIRYMRANVVESYMPRTQVFQTYWVRRNGSIRSGNETLARGTRVFTLRNGEPVLKWACGNPLTASLPYVKTNVATDPKSPKQKMAANIEVQVPSEPTDVIVPSEPDAVPVEAVAASAPVMVASEPVVPHVAPLNFSPMAAAVPAAHAGLTLGTLGAIASVPVAIAATHKPSSSNVAPAPTPESGTMISLGGMALAGFAFTRKRPKKTAR